jgi:CDP-glucose 4,6-dehydratase
VNKDFWKDKKVLITGNMGFKGTWLTLLLHSLGARVTGYSLYPETIPNMYWQVTMNVGFSQRCDTVLNNLDLDYHIKENEIIFHLASQAIVKKAYYQPYETILNNSIGILNILESLRNTIDSKTLINVTTDKVYKNNQEKYSFKEGDELGYSEPYSFSKFFSELVTDLYRSMYLSNHKVYTVRAGNVIGGGDYNDDRIIVDCVKAIENKNKLVLRNPNYTRPFIYVLDVLAGYIEVAEQTPKDKAFNFSLDSYLSIIDLATNFMKFFNYETEIEFDMTQEFKEDKFLNLNSQKAKDVLQWYPKKNIMQAITSTAIWYKEYLNKGNVEKITYEQISEYL